MRRTALLFLMPFLLGATDGEDKCANPDNYWAAGKVQCHCSEPLDEQESCCSGGSNHNPSGTTGAAPECRGLSAPAGDAITGGDPDLVSWVSPSDLTGHSPAMSALPNVDYVLEHKGPSGSTKVGMPPLVFTDGTLCTRYYIMYESGGVWDCDQRDECTADGVPHSCCDMAATDPWRGCECNMKGPRYMGNGLENLGFQSSNSNSRKYWTFSHCTFGAQGSGQCGDSTDYVQDVHCKKCEPPGCSCSGGNLLRNTVSGFVGDDIVHDDYEGHWLRREICFDHNPQSGVPETGNDYIWARVRETMVTGPKAGQVQYHGPARGHHGISVGSCGQGSNAPCRMWTSGNGTQNGAQHEGDQYVSFFMAAHLPTADPTFWIGGAAEIEGSAAVPDAGPDPAAPDSGTAPDSQTPQDSGDIETGPDGETSTDASAAKAEQPGDGTPGNAGGGCNCAIPRSDTKSALPLLLLLVLAGLCRATRRR